MSLGIHMQEKNCFFRTSNASNVGERKRREEPTRSAIPRLSIQTSRENPLSKRLRRLDNTSLTHAPKHSAGVYITTNEERPEVIAARLAETPNTSQGCHIGFSGWYNLDLMALRQSSLGIICDHNPENAYFLSVTLNTLLKCANREEFVNKMRHFIDTHDFDQLKREPGNNLDAAIKFSGNFRADTESCFPSNEVNGHLKVKTGWLANEERFQFIKFLAQNDKIVLLTEDIMATETFIKIRKLLQENSVEIDTLYLSNISAYMNSPEAKACFTETVQALSERETKIIDARGDYYRNCRDLAQRLTSPKLLLDPDKAKHWWWEEETIEEFLLRETPEERSKREAFSRTLFKPSFLNEEKTETTAPSYTG